MRDCPCGLPTPYHDCCGQYIEQDLAAPTPEALMRSRYTAFVLGKIAYIQQTMRGIAAKDFSPEKTQQWLDEVTWISLHVSAAKMKTPRLGFVTFEARYHMAGKLHVMREKSEFHLIENRWYYVAGKAMNPHIGTQ